MNESPQSKQNPLQWLLSRPLIAISLAVAVLAVGYGDLVLGGMTISAAMLTLGYVIMVPVAIMAVPAAQRSVYRAGRRGRDR